VVVLLRSTSNRQFIQARLSRIEVRVGAIHDPASLRAAMRDVTHVIHCAGLTKALTVAGFFEGNQVGTRHVVEAVNQRREAIQRLVHISSLAAGGPAVPDLPALEEDPPQPVSAYGQSKLAGETEVKTRCQVPYVIVRPPAVYGPRDDGFLSLFQAVKRGVVPHFIGSLAALSMIYAKDLAQAVVVCLTHPAAAQRTYYAASPDVLHGEAFSREIARQMKARTVTVPLPAPVLWVACLVQEGVSQLIRRPNILGLQKYRELRAPGWVCDPSRLRDELGFVAATPHAEGIAETLAWYRQHGWL
jgi:nucleoside-diphosphate-sugar epimerase